MNSLETAQKGLEGKPKFLNHTLMYNKDSGSVFDAVCQEPEYYVYSNDMAILVDHAAEIAKGIGEKATLVELGCGLCKKSVPLLEALEAPASFVAVDIDPEVLKIAEAEIKAQFPDLPFVPVVGDIFRTPTLPTTGRTIGLMAGSTFGTYTDDDTAELIRCSFASLGEDSVLLASYDTNQDPETNLKPYRNASYAALVKSALHTLNLEYGANFDLEAFEHRPAYNAEAYQVEHNLFATSRQVVTMRGKEYVIEEGEKIMVYAVKKRSIEQLSKVASKAGAVIKRNFLDKDKFICFSWLEKAKQ